MDAHRSLTLLLACVVSVGLAACTADAEEPAGSDAATAAVEIADSSYSPADLEVVAGTSVTWSNSDDVPHTVTFDDPSVASSDQLAAGDSFTAAFPDAGTFDYVCALHPDMAGSVTVTG